MKRVIAMISMVFAVGCGGSPSNGPAADNKTSSTSGVAASSAEGKPSSEEATNTIREFFSGPSVGFSNVEVEKVSDPVETPKSFSQSWGDVWIYCVTMTCKNVVCEKQKNKDWLVFINRENGKATVKDYYGNLEKVEKSPLGKSWFVQKGLPDPTVIDD